MAQVIPISLQPPRAPEQPKVNPNSFGTEGAALSAFAQIGLNEVDRRIEQRQTTEQMTKTVTLKPKSPAGTARPGTGPPTTTPYRWATSG